MKRLRRLKLLQRLDSPLSQPLSDTSKQTITPFGTAQQPSKAKEKQRKYVPKNHPRHLCYWERVAISEQIKKGKTIADMARELGRSRKALCVEINRNGGRYKYNPEEAHKLSVERKQAKTVNLTKKNSVPLTLEQRIENLEMHVDILTDIIRSKKGEPNTINHRL